ncbi:MAG: hypothetical protein J6X80_08320 [Lachnospiraceae bacterium]|nr:hypothetical protein [Lachnospiraceae bacterium]
MSSYGSNASDVISAIMLSSFAIVYIILFIVLFVIMFALIAFIIVCNWKILQKAGEPGWKAIIPFYNYYSIADIALFKPTSIVVFIVFTVSMVITPCAAIPWVAIILGWLVWLAMMLANGVLNFGIAKAFGQDIAICVLAIFFAPVIRAIIAFSKKIEYTGDKLAIFPVSNN